MHFFVEQAVIVIVLLIDKIHLATSPLYYEIYVTEFGTLSRFLLNHCTWESSIRLNDLRMFVAPSYLTRKSDMCITNLKYFYDCARISDSKHEQISAKGRVISQRKSFPREGKYLQILAITWSSW